MYCSNCGKELLPGEEKCSSCGLPVNKSSFGIGNDVAVSESVKRDIYSSKDVLKDILSDKKSPKIPDSTGKKENKKSKPIVVAAIIAIVVLVAILMISLLASSSRRSTYEYTTTPDWHDETTSTTIRYTTTTQPTTTEPTTEYTTESYIPDELKEYSNRLVAEDRDYKIMLEESDWNILFRSAPVVTDSDDPNDNRIDKIPDGTVIHVEYIYDGVWAVYQYKGQWGFSAIYSGAKSSGSRLMYPVQ